MRLCFCAKDSRPWEVLRSVREKQECASPVESARVQVGTLSTEKNAVESGRNLENQERGHGGCAEP